MEYEEEIRTARIVKPEINPAPTECEHDYVFLETVKHYWEHAVESNYYRPGYGFSKADRFYCKKCFSGKAAHPKLNLIVRLKVN